MIAFAALLIAAAEPAPPQPPAWFATFLDELASGDAPAAHARLADDVMIRDAGGTAGSLEAVVSSVRGCRHDHPSWDVAAWDAQDGASSVIWTCPSHAGSQTMIWTHGSRVVAIQYGFPVDG